MADTKKSAKRTTATGKTSAGWSDEERAAMKERAKEVKAEARADIQKSVTLKVTGCEPVPTSVPATGLCVIVAMPLQSVAVTCGTRLGSGVGEPSVRCS